MLKRSKGADALAALVARPAHTQTSIATECGVSSQAVAQWVHGIAKPRAELREVIERLVGIPVEAWDDVSDADEKGAA